MTDCASVHVDVFRGSSFMSANTNVTGRTRMGFSLMNCCDRSSDCLIQFISSVKFVFNQFQ